MKINVTYGQALFNTELHAFEPVFSNSLEQWNEDSKGTNSDWKRFKRLIS